MRTAVIIPARYESSRLPGKPLVEINGVPMIERTWRRCVEAVGKSDVYVATDHARIAEYCEKAGIQVIMTSSTCLTGTDRVAEAALSVPADYYVNVQGDEPLISPIDVMAAIKAGEADPTSLHLGYCEIETEAQYRNPTIPKCVFRLDGRLLYVSRASIPAPKTLEYRRAWRPVWIYGFPPAALQAYHSHGAKTPIESIEDNEIIRFLELGYEVRMVPMSSESIAVDTIDDLDEVIHAMNARGLQ